MMLYSQQKSLSKSHTDFVAQNRPSRWRPTFAASFSLFMGAVVPTIAASEPAAQQLNHVNLSYWQQEGEIANGNWNVSEDNKFVRQTINGHPTFYVSPNNFINGLVRGSIKVETNSDDDFIGFVFGYKNPISKFGDDISVGNFLLFDWRQSDQKRAKTGYYLTKIENFSLPKEKFLPIQTDCFWNHAENLPGCKLLAKNNTLGWQDQTEYWFKLDYRTDRIIIEIGTDPNNLSTIFDLKGEFEPGRFGFYNHSQSHVRYADLTYESSPGSEGLLANNDTYGLKEGESLKVSAGDGVLINDTGFTLNGFTPEVGNTTTNGTLSLKSDGSFTYTPNGSFQISDSFTYRLYDGNQYSDTNS
jgi:hypothetical protein